ncbi:MAG: hypothetical protein KKC68_04510 [Candidatus Thermoplasmatota archaeon]|nr:hypothetical protein [Candidatus Thermoplasmatota archaeon]
MWQDVALSIINFGFILTLIPAIFRNFQMKNAASQSIITYCSTAILLTIMVFVLYTLELWFSSISTTGTAIMWYILTYQKLKYL